MTRIHDFESIYDMHKLKVFSLCMGYTNDADRAKDLLQETFIRIWQNLPKFRNESSIGTWVYRIASNVCLRQLEKDRHAANERISVNTEAEPEDDRENQSRFLYKCIAELEEVERIIISLVLDEVPYNEIASIVGITEGNLRVKVHRIKNKLTEKFKAYDL
jgi:RNA polymerase sigma-70 factor (ECF subfamily)